MGLGLGLGLGLGMGLGLALGLGLGLGLGLAEHEVTAHGPVEARRVPRGGMAHRAPG